MDNIITYDINGDAEQYDYFKYKDGYLEAIELAVMIKLKKDHFISYQNIVFKEQTKDQVWHAKQKTFIEEKVEKIFEIVEAPSAWYKINKKDNTIENFLNTKDLKVLTIKGQNIEYYLHDNLKDKGNIGLDKAMTALFEENNVSIDSDNIYKKLFCLSDQIKEISKYFASKEEVLNLDTEELRKWISIANEPDKLLHIVKHGNREMFERFMRTENISNDTIKNWKNGNLETLLHIAAINSNVQTITALIEGGTDIKAKTQCGDTALHYAVLCGKVEAIKALIDGGVEKEAKNNYGDTALDIAIDENNIEFIEVFISNNPKKIIVDMIKDGAGWVYDDNKTWEKVEKIINHLPQKERVEIVSKALEDIDNTSRRARLLSFLPEEEQNLTKSRVSSTILEDVCENFMKMHNNSSVNLPNRPTTRRNSIER